MRETARERSSDFDEKKLTDFLPPKEFQSATFVKYTFHKRIACECGTGENLRNANAAGGRPRFARVPRASARIRSRSKGCETRRLGRGEPVKYWEIIADRGSLTRGGLVLRHRRAFDQARIAFLRRCAARRKTVLLHLLRDQSDLRNTIRVKFVLVL